ncbi:hypothetical protein Tco_1071707 [Tanacetum coccineum]
MAYLHPHLPYLPLDQNGKIFNLCTDSVYFTDITSLPPRAQRHPWLRYQVKGYTKEIIHDFEQKVGTIFGRQINRVHVLDFAGLTVEMMQTLANRRLSGPASSYIYIRDLVRRLCYRHAKGRKSGSRMFGGHFIGRHATHLGLVSDEGLIGWTVIALEPPMIDMDKFVKLNICVRVGDTWAWVVPGLERQQVAVAGAPKDA